MTNHATNIVASRVQPIQYRAFCSCLMNSGWFNFRWQAEDWIRVHDELVNRVRAHLRNRTPSIRDQFNWYTKQSEDENNSAEERALWHQLAEEIRYRLSGTTDQDALPFEVEYSRKQRRITP